MKVDQRFRTYYYGLYGSLRLLYRRIYDETPVTVVQAESIGQVNLIMFSMKNVEL